MLNRQTFGSSKCYVTLVDLLIKYDNPKLTRVVSERIFYFRKLISGIDKKSGAAQQLLRLALIHIEQSIDEVYYHVNFAPKTVRVERMTLKVYTYLKCCIRADYRKALKEITS